MIKYNRKKNIKKTHVIKRFDGTHIIQGEVGDKKLEVLAQSTKGIDCSGNVLEKNEKLFDSMDELKKDWQHENCPTCIHYDSDEKSFNEEGFIEKGNINPTTKKMIDPKDCKYHVCFIFGNCVNYKKRNNEDI